jgi:2-oxo-4-hydroxy-4-carboxy-5-ureidoimidazoline decarboxylase
MTALAQTALERFNRDPQLAEALTELSGSPEWAAAMIRRTPFATEAALFAAADEVLRAQPDTQVRAAVAAHPRLGAATRSGTSSDREQQAARGADEKLSAALAQLSDRYEHRFGHVCLIRADGLSAEQIIAAMRARMEHHPTVEWAIVREQLGLINALRLERLLVRYA